MEEDNIKNTSYHKNSQQRNKNLDKINIIAININSICSNAKRYILLKFLEEQNPDILLINETKLNKGLSNMQN